MKIAVNTRFLLTDYLEGYGNFLQQVVTRMVTQHPEHEFIFFFDRPFDPAFIPAGNCKGVVIGPPARHPLLWKLWYDYKIPAALKKYKADVFLSCDGFCSLRTRVPQCLVIHDLAFLHYPDAIKRSHLFFYKLYTKSFLRKAATVATVSEFSKNDIIDQYGINENKIDVVYNAVKDGFHPIDETEKQVVRNEFTNGKNYFFYAGSVHPRKNLLNLLKAFSVFKKRQKTDWKLVITGRLAWKYERFLTSLKSYKYRDDVVLTDYVDEPTLVRLMGAAYGLVYPSLWEGFGVPVIEAMRCETPAITSAGSAMQEIAGDAALYADADNYQDIADKMMLLYKDESLRSRLIMQGKIVEKQYSWDRTAELLWQSVMNATGKSKK